MPLIPVVTMVGGGIPSLVGGSVIIEYIFNLPGMGRLMVDALNGRDYPIISAINLIMATIVIANNLFIDLNLRLAGSQDHLPKDKSRGSFR